MNHIILHVFYHCHHGMADAFIDTIRREGIQSAVRGEAGCLQYDYHLSLESPDTVVLLEKWQSADHLTAHMSQPHMARLQQLKAEFVEEVQIEKHLCVQPVSETALQ